MAEQQEQAGAVGSLLQQFSADLAAVVAQAGQGIVGVHARRRFPATGIVWSQSERGALIVSANHVIERDEEITIRTADERTLPAELVGRDPQSDLAVLRVDDATLQPAARAAGDAAQVGALVLALGRASGLSATLGLINGVGGPWVSRRRRQFARLISSDAVLLPGYSGGPLVDAGGKLLGVVSSHLGHDVTLAIPHQDVDQVVTLLSKHGRVVRGYLGIGTQPVVLPAALRDAAGQERGLLLVNVGDDSPAAQSGLLLGDILIALAGQSLQGPDDLRSSLAVTPIGAAVAVRLVRGGQLLDLTVTPTEAP